ncbi:MAG: hypothetical protein LBF72_04025 [Holosporales bacterium]|nr:hypothetical protein [Holosporales bacterium]
MNYRSNFNVLRCFTILPCILCLEANALAKEPEPRYKNILQRVIGRPVSKRKEGDGKPSLQKQVKSNAKGKKGDVSKLACSVALTGIPKGQGGCGKTGSDNNLSAPVEKNIEGEMECTYKKDIKENFEEEWMKNSPLKAKRGDNSDDNPLQLPERGGVVEIGKKKNNIKDEVPYHLKSYANGF